MFPYNFMFTGLLFAMTDMHESQHPLRQDGGGGKSVVLPTVRFVVRINQYYLRDSGGLGWKLK